MSVASKVKGATQVARVRTVPARQAAASYTSTAASAIATPVEQRRSGSVLMMIIGYSLLAILVYIAIANKPVVNATSGLANLGSRTVKAWIDPVDPIASLTGSLGLNGAGSSSLPGSTSGGSIPGGSVSGGAPSQPPPPNPQSIAHTPVSRLPGRSSSPATLNLFHQLRQQRIREGVLHA